MFNAALHRNDTELHTLSVFNIIYEHNHLNAPFLLFLSGILQNNKSKVGLQVISHIFPMTDLVRTKTVCNKAQRQSAVIMFTGDNKDLNSNQRLSKENETTHFMSRMSQNLQPKSCQSKKDKV